MAELLQAGEIGLRITNTAWRGNEKYPTRQGFVSFVCSAPNLRILFPNESKSGLSAENSHLLAEKYLQRFWSADRTCTAVVSNISMDENEPLYLLMPVLEGGATAGYATDEGIAAFRCIIKNGYFLAIGFESGFYCQQPGPNRVRLTGPVYIQKPPVPGEPMEKTRPPRSLPKEILQRMSALKSRRLQVARRLSQWQTFLDWQLGIVRQRQFGLRFQSFKADDSSQCLHFLVSAGIGELKVLARKNCFAASAMPLSASKDPKHWQAVDENVRGVFLGEVFIPRARIKKLLQNCDADGQINFEIKLEPERKNWNRCRDRLGEEGFLVNAIFMDEIPFKRQQDALNKLTRSECYNPRLADFLFDATKARTPDVPLAIPTDNDPCDVKFNKQQKLTISKVLKAEDLFLIQGPPGTGKTTVLAELCRLQIEGGKRVLVASQANVAVNNILARLADRPDIRPLRLGNGYGSQDDKSPFHEDGVVYQWLSAVRKSCRSAFNEGKNLTAAGEQVEDLWPHFTEMITRHEKLLNEHSNLQQRISSNCQQVDKITDDLETLNKRTSRYSTAAAALDQLQRRLCEHLSFMDTAEWVQLLPIGDRQRLFGPLLVWNKEIRLPESVKMMFSTPQSDNSGIYSDSQNKSWATSLLSRFGRYFANKTHKQDLSVDQAEPNYAVEWIKSGSLLNQLIRLQANLPELLELCREGERLCAVQMISEVSEQAWSKYTASLHKILDSLGKESVERILKIESISISLRPKRKFAVKLAKARNILSKLSETVPQTAEGLSDTLVCVGKACSEHIGKSLANFTGDIEQAESNLDWLQSEQDQADQRLEHLQNQISRLESAWHEVINSLPGQLHNSIAGENLPLCPESLQALNAARDRYQADTSDQLENHKLWGPIQAKWLGLIENPSETDRQRLTPMYLRQCNIVGATCSYSGSRGGFLSRDECSRFDIVVIDEVSKATPPELLVPALLASTLILAGDYRQLPPTFKEGPALEQTFGELAEIDPDFEQAAQFKQMVTASLFKRLFYSAPEIIKQALVVQHRMHPQIMEVINQFYNGQLRCGIENPDKKCDHGLVIKTGSGEFLKPQNHILWVDTSRDSHGRLAYEKQVGTSKANILEAESTVKTVKLLNKAAGQAGRAPGSVKLGIITFYGQQVRLIACKLGNLKSCDKKFLDISLSTVDNFQGAECSIVIVSLVRAKRGRIGSFTRAFERINVAMSRAQKLLIILGAAKTFANMQVPLPGPDDKTTECKCYSHILDVVKKYGGMRDTRDLFGKIIEKTV